MTTDVNNIKYIEEKEDDIDLDEELLDLDCDDMEKALYLYCTDLMNGEDIRLKALTRYYNEYGDNTINIVNKLCGMYQFSMTKTIEKYLHRICTDIPIPVSYKFEIVKSLFFHNKEVAYTCLEHICIDLQDMPTPCKIEAILMLMGNSKYRETCVTNFVEIVGSRRLNSDFKYKTILSLEGKDIDESDRRYYLEYSLLTFLNDVSNEVMYKILSGQYLLKMYNEDTNEESNEDTNEDNIIEIEKILLNIAEDVNVEYNCRADATDTLINLGSEKVKQRAKKLILELGKITDVVRTVFQNAQNAHSNEIEESACEIIEHLTTIPTDQHNGKDIDFEYVSREIKKLVIDEDDLEDIEISLNRINIDRALYSKTNSTLLNILLKLWSYMSDHDCKDEMHIRLVQELKSMSGTCTSGFASRLANTLSGFGRFNIRISWEDQIISNLFGRLNFRARRLTEKNSIFRTDENKLRDVIELFLNRNYYYTALNQKIDRISDYLMIDREEKIEECLEEFEGNVLGEMGVDTSKFEDRMDFLLFFRTYISDIRNEMYDEFKGHITDTDFDLYFRSAIMKYEIGD